MIEMTELIFHLVESSFMDNTRRQFIRISGENYVKTGYFTLMCASSYLTPTQ